MNDLITTLHKAFDTVTITSLPKESNEGWVVRCESKGRVVTHSHHDLVEALKGCLGEVDG